jgi:hypothetical protein
LKNVVKYNKLYIPHQIPEIVSGQFCFSARIRLASLSLVEAGFGLVIKNKKLSDRIGAGC